MQGGHALPWAAAAHPHGCAPSRELLALCLAACGMRLPLPRSRLSRVVRRVVLSEAVDAHDHGAAEERLAVERRRGGAGRRGKVHDREAAAAPPADGPFVQELHMRLQGGEAAGGGGVLNADSADVQRPAAG